MPEAGYLPIPKKLSQKGVKDMIRISDARMSGSAFGTIILHVTPESNKRGPLSIIRTGDRIKLSASNKILEKSARVIGVGGDDISQYYPSIKLLDRTIELLPWKKIISHNYNIANVHEAMDRAMSDKSMKVLLNP